jgi:Protein of unknown function (DUF402)
VSEVRHAPGEQVLVQEIWRDEVWAARPMKVVHDQDDYVALWFPEATRWKAPVPPPGRSWENSRGEWIATCLERGEWAFVDREWDVSTLVLMRPGDWHALWCSWRDGQHLSWYVNLQEPFRRTNGGFETMDLALDVIIPADRGDWYWKDEDELATFVERGVFDEELAVRLREEGLRVVGRAERSEWPFADGWPDWRSDPSWGRPELPDEWRERCR